MTRMTIECAKTALPAAIASKVQAIAGENDVRECELCSERVISPLWDHTFPLPRNARMWVSAEGHCWLLSSDGEIYVEPTQGHPEQQESSLMGESVLWVITLDDAAEHLRVSRCLLIAPEKGKPLKAPPMASEHEVLTWFTFDITIRGQISVIARDGAHARDVIEKTIENLTSDDSDVPSLDLRVDDCWEA